MAMHSTSQSHWIRIFSAKAVNIQDAQRCLDRGFPPKTSSNAPAATRQPAAFRCCSTCRRFCART
eukprot:304421-Pyramimonas_sp.AAC.1